MILPLLASCGRNTLEGSFCTIYRPVYYDPAKDTPETISQIDLNNVVYERCKEVKLDGGILN